MKYIELESERLIFRKFKQNDFPVVFDWLNNLENPSTLTWAIWTTIVWPSPGYGIVMYCAAFSAINPALYEAAVFCYNGCAQRRSFSCLSYKARRRSSAIRLC